MKMGTEKMSKSKGNEVVVTKLLERVPAETLRFLLLSTHYRRPIEFNEEHLQEIQRGLDGFYRFFERYERITRESFYQIEAPTSRKDSSREGLEDELARLRDRFFECMDDDFNTGGAIGVLYEYLNALNRHIQRRSLEVELDAHSLTIKPFKEGVHTLKELSQLLGLFRVPVAPKEAAGDQLVNGLLQLLVDLRAEGRKSKNFALADQIRSRLQQLGVTLEDRSGGTTWRIQ
jgi:cysteinyl-tRNA synthetase